MKKFKKIYNFFILIIIIIISNCFITSGNVKADENIPHVLIINSYNQSYKWTDEIVKGISTSLKSENKKIFIDTEYMDTKRNFEKEYFEKLHELFKYKYSKRKFDLIICSDDDALNFMMKYGDDLFNNVPIVFCGINDLNENLLKEHKNYTGVLENISYKETLDIAIRLNPGIRKIAFLTDNTTTGKKNIEEVKSLQSKYTNIEFLFYYDMDICNLEKKISDLPLNSAIVFMSTVEQSYGKTISLQEFSKKISNISKVPVYILWDNELGTGTLGGMVTSGYYQGLEAGKLGNKILNGVSPDKITIVKTNVNKYMFDYNMLKKFEYKISSLPKESIIVNEPSKRYDIPKSYIVYSLLILIIISIMFNYILIKNISEREQTEKLLRESEEQYRKLFELSPDAIFVDKDGIIKIANKAALKLLAVDSYEELIGQNIIKYVPEERLKAFANYRLKIGDESLEAVIRESKVLRKDGSTIDVELVSTFFPYKGENMILTVQRDITDHVKLMEAIQYDKMKTDFFANISHELRTPLNVILSAIQLLDLYDKQGKTYKIKSPNKYRNIMRQNCFRLLRLINNLIDITKIDADYLKPNLQNYDIIRLVEDITMSVADYIENKNISLIFDTEVEEKIIACDVDKIERIMLNLLSNAVKFTNEGDTIFVNIYDKEDSVEISVKDTGIGIPEDKLHMIFERFKQVDKSLSRNREGSGIGLSLVKSFVEMQGGKVSVSSNYGEGSEFIIKLPVQLVESVEPEKNYHRQVKSKCVERINIEFSDIYE